jgi:hypothetical protein
VGICDMDELHCLKVLVGVYLDIRRRGGR